MKAHLLGFILTFGCSTVALAQGANSVSGVDGSTSPAEVQSKLRAGGHTPVGPMHREGDKWVGSAIKDGRPVDLSVDAKGGVSTGIPTLPPATDFDRGPVLPAQTCSRRPRVRPRTHIVIRSVATQKGIRRLDRHRPRLSGRPASWMGRIQ